jgi:hypothetical protein
MRIPKGRPGSWFAEWKGESLPCIHQHAIKRGLYVDNGVDDHPAWPRFIAELRARKRAIVTTSHPAGADGIRRRKTYVGIWEIGEVEVVEPTADSKGQMTFSMGEPLHRFRG